MSLYLSTRAEMIKTKRSASFWLSVLGAGFVPFIFLLIYLLRPEKNYGWLEATPWENHFLKCWEVFSVFLLPMFVILICSLIPQIEYKNNGWKQVFASPQSIGNIFFSKYIAIVLMIAFLFLLYNIFMILAGVIADLAFSRYTFLNKPIDWLALAKLNIKTFISLLGIISIQYWLSIRFRNFIISIGVGLALLVAALTLSSWEHIDKVPHAFPLLTYLSFTGKTGPKHPLLNAHEWNSIVYFIFFTLLAFLDMRFRKERG